MADPLSEVPAVPLVRDYWVGWRGPSDVAHVYSSRPVGLGWASIRLRPVVGVEPHRADFDYSATRAGLLAIVGAPVGPLFLDTVVESLLDLCVTDEASRKAAS